MKMGAMRASGIASWRNAPRSRPSLAKPTTIQISRCHRYTITPSRKSRRTTFLKRNSTQVGNSPEPEVEAPDPVEPEQDVPVEEPYRGKDSSPAAIAAPERPPWVSAAAIIPEWLACEPVAHDPPNDIPAAPMTAEEALQRPVFADTTPDEPEEVADPAPVAERGEPISDINPPPDFEPDPLDTPLRPLDADTTKMVQKIYDLPKWKGKITEAHQLAPSFFGHASENVRRRCGFRQPRGGSACAESSRAMIADAAARIDEAA